MKRNRRIKNQLKFWAWRAKRQSTKMESPGEGTVLGRDSKSFWGPAELKDKRQEGGTGAQERGCVGDLTAEQSVERHVYLWPCCGSQGRGGCGGEGARAESHTICPLSAGAGHGRGATGGADGEVGREQRAEFWEVGLILGLNAPERKRRRRVKERSRILSSKRRLQVRVWPGLEPPHLGAKSNCS